MLADSLRTLFTAAVRSRGTEYYLNGQVEEEIADPLFLLADVFGSENYGVLLLHDRRAERFRTYCTCPHFMKGNYCKHLWGAIELADEFELFATSTILPRHVEQLEPETFVKLQEWLREGNRIEGLNPETYDSLFEMEGFDEPESDPEDTPLPSPSSRFHGSTFTRSPDRPTPSTRGSRTDVWSRVEQGWQQRMQHFRFHASGVQNRPLHGVADRELMYYLADRDHLDVWGITVDLGRRERLKNGEFGAVKFSSISPRDIPDFSSSLDRTLLAHFAAEQSARTISPGFDSWLEIRSGRISDTLVPTYLPEMARSGRLMFGTPDGGEAFPLQFDENPWSIGIRVDSAARRPRPGASPKRVRVSTELRKGEERIEPSDVRSIVRAGFVVVGDRLLPVHSSAHIATFLFLKEEGVELSTAELPVFLQQLSRFGPLPEVHRTYVDDDAADREPGEQVDPIPQLSLAAGKSFVTAELEFLYGDIAVAPSTPSLSLFDGVTGRLYQRRGDLERGYVEELRAAGFALSSGYQRDADRWQIPSRKLARVAAGLIDRGWRVLAQGKLSRSNGSFNLSLTSGVDWFDLDGEVYFDDTHAPLGRLLEALGRGERLLLLDDGSYGMIPDEWFEKFGKLRGFYDRESESVRFGSHQTILLDLLLADMPEVRFDEVVSRARERLESFTGVAPLDPPDSFQGELRPYQKIALGWFGFLRDFGFGGCLADDMGLGKTVQVLALLEERRRSMITGKRTAKKRDSSARRVSLAVVPKSLIFNWQREAEAFVPELKVLNYTGIARKEYRDRFDEYDLIVTTYGTMRRDIQFLADREFDYVILDESQAIKNAGSNTSKGARLLKGRHRLAMSGTPIENRVEELWSLFEFLNPGMLGSQTLFAALTAEGSEDSSPDNDEQSTHQGRQRLARLLRPYILRRTKAEVAPDLPEKIEQTLYCDLSKKERAFYERLRNHIRAEVLGVVDSVGLNRSSIKVLEGLLRLRQAACHPALIDREKSGLDSAKFDILLPMIDEMISEGHKGLIFSQFTSYLALLRKELEARGIPYEYLDGKTRDRAGRVDRFQNSPEVPLFLISLKAGGVGLNLTAAEYVFLLDPWWNPAVEAQAIDRTHRIGQSRTVVAHRIIARDTIEEKVLDLQQKKRELAESLISGENSLIHKLTREELEDLLT